MRLRPLLLPTLGLGFAAIASAADPFAELVRPTDWQSPEVEAKSFTLPPGFKIELFASEPMINKPINLAFDEKGRLWVSSNTEYPFPAAKERWADEQGSRVRDSKDAIKILEDTNGDGKADKVTDFADGLNVPIAVLPYKNGCIAWSIPNIWYFADNDGDGKCDERKVLFGPLGYQKDTHGNIASLRLAPDGWVYATHGFNNVSHFEVRPENRKTPIDATAPKKPTPSWENAHLPKDQLDWGNSLDLQSGNVFRFRPDGSVIEIWAWGQVNPFGLTWDSWGNLYSADCHSNPTTQLIRGAFYPSFGRPHNGIGFAPVLCEHSHGSTGICGPLYLDGGVWGAEWDDHMLVCNPVTSRINHDLITYTGATPKANERPDFLSTTDPWFRPVDIRLAPDGALFIADFYNRIIGHYEVDIHHPGRDRTSGRIWRVTKEGVKSDARKPSDAQKLATALRFGLEGFDPGDVAKLEPKIQRQLIENGNLPVEPLLAILAATPENDPTLAYTTKLAIRRALFEPGTFGKIAPDHRMADAVAFLARSVATPEASAWLLAYLKAHPNERHELGSMLKSLARYLPADRVPELVAIARERFQNDAAAQADLLISVTNGLAERGVSPEAGVLAWAQQLADTLATAWGANPAAEWEAAPNTLEPDLPASKPAWGTQKRKTADGREITVISSLSGPGDGGVEQRTGILRSRAFPCPEKLALWLCGHRGYPDKPEHAKNFVRLVDDAGHELQRAFPPRNDTATRVEWTLSATAGKQVRLEIVDGDTGDAYAWLGVGGIEPAVVSAERFGGQDASRGRLQTLAALLQHTAPAALRQKLAGFLPPPPPAPPSVVTPEQRAELDKLIAARLDGLARAKADPAKGRAVFTANCAVCHALGGQGALVGPQLDGAGVRGAARLVEDIIDPNRNIDSNFYVHVITQKDGSVVAGLERGSVGQVLLCVDATGKEHRLNKADIAKNDLTGLSLMPAAFAYSIPEADFYDLVAFLLAEKK